MQREVEVESIFIKCYHFFVFSLMKLTCSGKKFKDFQNGYYHIEKSITDHKNLDTVGALLLLEQMKTEMQYQQEQKNSIDEKIRNFLTLNTIVFSALCVLMNITDNHSFVIFISLICFFFSIILILHYITLSYTMKPDSLDAKFKKDRKSIALALIKDYKNSINHNNGIYNFHADVYRAARRFFLYGLVIAFSVMSYSFINKTYNQEYNTDVQIEDAKTKKKTNI